MVRNTMKVIDEMHRGKINSRYDIYSENVEEILKNSTDYVGAILDSFVFGYAQGMKAARAEMKKRTKAVSV